ncbi:MAG: hypothetical protein QW622_02265 [Candidatus Pacearchaeota archaeon]
MKNELLAFSILAFFVFSFALECFQIVYAQKIPGLPASLTPEEIVEKQAEFEKLKNVTEWQLIGERFKEMLLKNSFISGMNSFMERPYVSIIFRILFGMPYELSITLLFVVVLWLIIFIDLGNIFSSYSTFSGLASYGISFAIAVIFAQVQIFKIIVNFVGTLIFARETWLARVLLVISVIFILLFTDQISRYVADYLQKRKEAKEKEEAKTAEKEVKEFARGMEAGREIVEKA